MILNDELQAAREDYRQAELDENATAENPFDQFSKWFEEYRESKAKDHNAMIVSTVSADGQPSSRTVLLKGFSENGFVFYTNYQSQKGKEIEQNPKVSLLFYWPELERQIRVDGKAGKIPPDKSTAYFEKRPRGSQIGAWASPQSQKVENREKLEEWKNEFDKKFGESVPRPPQWGGYAVIPEKMEFWQGRSDRLHDRILYEKVGGKWKKGRLAP